MAYLPYGCNIFEAPFEHHGEFTFDLQPVKNRMKIC
jgi:hypothetical protein